MRIEERAGQDVKFPPLVLVLALSLSTIFFFNVTSSVFIACRGIVFFVVDIPREANTSSLLCSSENTRDNAAMEASRSLHCKSGGWLKQTCGKSHMMKKSVDCVMRCPVQTINFFPLVYEHGAGSHTTTGISFVRICVCECVCREKRVTKKFTFFFPLVEFPFSLTHTHTRTYTYAG